MTSTNTKELGDLEESRAASYLEELGYEIIERNWRWSNKGEIDIIALDSNRFGKPYIVFVEVKFREWSIEMAIRAVNHNKISQLKKLAQIYLMQKKLSLYKTHFSFDLVAISGTRLEHIKDIVK
ncbi:MAG: YraN family protein [Cyanobacteria bacterium]|nr:YraN family protein [Cyanobacteriota bacterium]